jgi:Protein of unknown function (DUF3996)
MKLRLALFALAVLALSAGTSEARRNRKMGGQKYVSNGKFGLGLELGAPTGINGKVFLSDDRALNFGVGGQYYVYDREGLHLYMDYLFHPFVLTTNEDFQLPFFVGIGARIWDFRDRGNGRDDDGFALGVRVPIGLAFDFNKVPLDVFVQLTFVVDAFFGYRDNFGPHFEGSVGIRYWFD